MAVIRKYQLAQVLILLACGMGVGFTLRTITRGNAEVDGAVAESPSENRTQGSDVLRRGEAGPFVGTIEEQIAAALRQSSEEDQKQASRAIFSRLGLDELTPLASQVEKMTAEFSDSEGGRGGWIVCKEFYGRWGELAPAEALKFLENHDSHWAGQKEAVWTAWARTDPDGAAAAYDPKLESSYSRDFKEAILEGLCSVDPAKALRFADAQEMGNDNNFSPESRDEVYARHSKSSDLLEYIPVERPDDLFGRALYSWIHRDPDGSLEVMLTLRYKILQQAALNALFSNWMMFDPAAAIRSLKKIPDRGLRESTTHTAMQAYLLRHPRAAFEKIIELPKYVSYRYKSNPSVEPDPFDDVGNSPDAELVEMDEEDGNETIPYRYCDTTPTRTHGRMDLISEAAASLGIAEGKAAWDVALAIDDKHKRAAALGGALAGWLIFDMDEAVRFTSAGISSHSFENPGGPDFPLFAVRLVSKNLAQHDFKKAINWVESLPAGPLREAGIDRAAWTRLDLSWDVALREASPDGWVDSKVHQNVQRREYAPVIEWLASLPSSKGRDDAAYWLVCQLEDHDDPSDALKWAATIDDPRLRGLCFKSLARKIFSKKNDSGAVDFDFEAWSVRHPKLTEELKRELARKKNDRGGGDEK